MKINAVVSYLTGLLIVSYLLVMQIHVDEYGDLSRFVPANALLYFEQHDASKELKKFNSSLLGKQLSSIDFLEVGEEIGLSHELLSQIELFLDSGGRLKNNHLLYQFFGTKLAIALMPPAENSHQTDLLHYLKENTLIIATPVRGASFLESISTAVGRYKDNGSFTTAQYGNHQVKRIILDGNHISYATIDGCYLISFDERLLRRCLDVFDVPQSSLALDEEFRISKKSFDNPSRFIYLPIKNVRNFVSSLLSRYDLFREDILSKELETTVGFSSFTYGAWQKNKIVEDKIVVRYNPHQVNELVQNHVKTPPVKCEMFSYVSKDPILYYWSNTFNFKHFLPYLDHALTQDDKTKNAISTFELISGKTLDEALSLLGDEVSLVMKKSPDGTEFQVPLTLILVKSSSLQQLKVIMKNIVTEYEIPIRTRKYKSAMYSYWGRASQDGARPLYGFYDGYFLVGNSTSLLKEVIDVHQSDRDLTKYKKFRRIDPGFKLANNSVTYLDNVEILKIVQKVVDFYGTVIAIKNRDVSSKLRLINDKIISPLLEGATMYDSSATRSYYIPNGVIIESKTHISR